MKISTAADLQTINQNLSGNYVLTENIDVSSIDGFSPLGSERAPFTGSLDGQGHEIRGLTLTRNSTSRIGLFDTVSDGEVRNLRLGNIDVTGGNHTGGLVGYNAGGSIDQVEVTGNVRGKRYTGGLIGFDTGGRIRASTVDVDVTGHGDSGGVVGLIRDGSTLTGVVGSGTVHAEGFETAGGLIGSSRWSGDRTTIRNCRAAVGVTADNAVGGLVGEISDARVEQSAASGQVEAKFTQAGGLFGRLNGGSDKYDAVVRKCGATGPVTAERIVGGLVGRAAGTVENAYAHGSVSGQRIVGGLIGTATAEARIAYTYATGAVDGQQTTGGLIASAEPNTTVTDSYWDTETTNQSSSTVLPDTQGLPTEEMTGESATQALSGFDFQDVWEPNDTYPGLRLG